MCLVNGIRKTAEARAAAGNPLTGKAKADFDRFSNGVDRIESTFNRIGEEALKKNKGVVGRTQNSNPVLTAVRGGLGGLRSTLG